MKTTLWQTIGFMLLTLVTMTGCDLATKSWARSALSVPRANAPAVCDSKVQVDQRVALRPKVLVHDVFELRYAENCGAAWSLLSTASKPVRMTFFVTVNVAALVLLASLARPSKRPSRRVLLGAGLAASGALGNLLDRLTHGYVTDFFYVHAGQSWSYPIFNVADILVGVGVGLIVIDPWFSPKDSAATPSASV